MRMLHLYAVLGLVVVTLWGGAPGANAQKARSAPTFPTLRLAWTQRVPEDAIKTGRISVWGADDVIAVTFATKAISKPTGEFARAIALYDARDGAFLWRTNAVVDAQPLSSEQVDLLDISGGRVYLQRVRYDQRPGVSRRDRQIATLDVRDARTGKTLWTAPMRDFLLDTMNKAERVFVVGLDGKLRALNAQTGRVIWEIETLNGPDWPIRFILPNHPDLIFDVSAIDRFWIVNRETGATKMSPSASEYLRLHPYMWEFTQTSLSEYLPKARVFLLNTDISKGGSEPQILNADWTFLRWGWGYPTAEGDALIRDVRFGKKNISERHFLEADDARTGRRIWRRAKPPAPFSEFPCGAWRGDTLIRRSLDYPRADALPRILYGINGRTGATKWLLHLPRGRSYRVTRNLLFLVDTDAKNKPPRLRAYLPPPPAAPRTKPRR